MSVQQVQRGTLGTLIELKVTNNLGWPIGFVYVGYKISTPGRTIPWLVETFATHISGGLEPGETQLFTTAVPSLPRSAKNVVIASEVLDVADAEKRQLIGGVKFEGNVRDLSPLECSLLSQKLPE